MLRPAFPDEGPGIAGVGELIAGGGGGGGGALLRDGGGGGRLAFGAEGREGGGGGMEPLPGGTGACSPTSVR